MVEQVIQQSLVDTGRPTSAPLKGVSISEPDPSKLEPMQHVVGKGKAIATEEIAAETLLKISSPASKSTDSQQYILKKSVTPPKI